MFTPMFLFAPAVVLVAVLALNAFQNERVFSESSTSNEHAFLAKQRAIKPYGTVVRQLHTLRRRRYHSKEEASRRGYF